MRARAATVEVRARSRLPVRADGKLVGTTPATFSALPAALGWRWRRPSRWRRRRGPSCSAHRPCPCRPAGWPRGTGRRLALAAPAPCCAGCARWPCPWHRPPAAPSSACSSPPCWGACAGDQGERRPHRRTAPGPLRPGARPPGPAGSGPAPAGPASARATGRLALALPAWLPGLALTLLLSLPAWAPFLHPRLDVGRLLDGDQHLAKAYSLAQLLAGGEWFPRWTPDLYGGYGYPTFVFYAPATYYLLLAAGRAARRPAWPPPTRWSGRSPPRRSWRGRTPWAGRCGATARRPCSRPAAAAYAPYALAINLFVRGAVPEVAGLALLVWLLCAVTRAWRTRRARGGRPATPPRTPERYGAGAGACSWPPSAACC